MSSREPVGRVYYDQEKDYYEVSFDKYSQPLLISAQLLEGMFRGTVRSSETDSIRPRFTTGRTGPKAITQ